MGGSDEVIVITYFSSKKELYVSVGLKLEFCFYFALVFLSFNLHSDFELMIIRNE